MQRSEGMTLDYARELARALVELLRPACQCIEVAGSIRRQKPNPNDIELVAVPRIETWAKPVQGDLFQALQEGTAYAEENALDMLCNLLLEQGHLEKRPDSQGRHCWGTGIKRMVFFRGGSYAPVDLFQVIDPVQWGVIHAIRTGPGDFNHRLVTSRKHGGGCPLDRKVAGGRVWDLTAYTTIERHNVTEMPATKFLRLVGRGIPGAPILLTPDEEDFFMALGVPCWFPQERTERRLLEFLQSARRQKDVRG